MKTTFTLIASFLLFAFSGIAQQANVQLVHNSSDTSISEVDVYFADTLAFENFSYRQASSFVPVDTSSDLIVSIADTGSADTSEAIYKDTLSLVDDNYHLVANGVLNETLYADNPDGRDIGFGLQLNAGAQMSAGSSDSLDFRVLHGSTDAPYIDFVSRSSSQILFNNMAYGDLSNYLSIGSGTYIFDVMDSANQRVLHTVYLPEMNLTPLLGQSALVYASGFMEPSANENGAGFELLAAMPNGRVDTLITLNFANVQITHNAPDPAFEQVDLYLDEEKIAENFPFKGSTPFISLPANDTVEIGIAPGGSSGPGEILATFERRFTSLQSYNLMAVGVSDPSAFPENPDGRNTALNLLTSQGFEDVPDQFAGGDTAITSFVHGVPDAPTTDVTFSPAFYQNSNQLSNFGYLARTQQPLPFMAQSYDDVAFIDTANDEELVAFEGDVSDYADSSMVTYVSGFVTDTGNLPEVQLHSVMPDGTTYTWNKQTVGFEKQAPEVDFGLGVYPNPAVDETKVSFNLDQRKDVNMTVYNNNGQAVKQIEVGEKAKGAHEKVIDLSNLKSGLYHLQLEAGESVNNAKLLVR